MYRAGRLYERAGQEDFLNRFTGNEDCDLNALIDMEIEMEEEKVWWASACWAVFSVKGSI